jgi:putative transposase
MQRILKSEHMVYNRGMRKVEWETTGNAVYNTGYHFVWSVKYRRQVLRAPIDQTVKEILAEICQEKGYRLLEMEVMPDHIHIFVSAPPKISPAEIARFLRGSSARYLFQRHPGLKRWLWGGHLWNPSDYVGTAGHVSAETIQKYIENQKVKR